MHSRTRAIAAIQLALIAPAALFLTAVLVAMGDAPQYDLARIAQRIVMGYSARMWTLWLLMLGLPFAALVTGCATLLWRWNHDVELAHPTRLALIAASLATVFVATTTLLSAAILAIVMLHMLAN